MGSEVVPSKISILVDEDLDSVGFPLDFSVGGEVVLFEESLEVGDGRRKLADSKEMKDSDGLEDGPSPGESDAL